MPDKITITKPGVYDIPAGEYHADPCPDGSLSSSSAKLILPVPFKGCPAKFNHARNTPAQPKKIFDFGHVAHKLVLGRGEHIKVLPYEDFRTKEAKKARDDARKAGQVPIKASDFDIAQQMATAVFSHPLAGKLFEGGVGERSLFWRCSQTGVMCRCRPDYLPTGGSIIPDYKTTGQTVTQDDIQRTTDNLGYWLQAAWYLDGIKTLGLAENPSFEFVFQETAPPHIVTVAQLDPVYIEWGRTAMLKAREMFAECQKSGDWSAGYHDDVVTIEPPGYSEHRLEAAMDKGAFDLACYFQGPHSDDVMRVPLNKRSEMEIVI
ncbi:MAG: hypothetical protein GY835_18310 [bacterium]|nr:hypothetical protein [bacterium]